MGKYIGETIASIDLSSYVQKEIIIVNDGSNGKEDLRMLDSLRGRKDIKVIDQENTGLATARNQGSTGSKRNVSGIFRRG